VFKVLIRKGQCVMHSPFENMAKKEYLDMFI